MKGYNNIYKRLNALMPRKIRILFFAGLSMMVILIILLLPPIPQGEEYHSFADQRNILGISNFLNVISNIPFFLVSVMGLYYLWRQRLSDSDSAFIDRPEMYPYIVLFIGVGLTCFGSVYYHLEPENYRLTWDRLPMTLIFMSFFAAIITDRISVKAGLLSLLPLLIIGIGSVIYWHISELSGSGDLRPYIIVQFYPMIAIPLILFLFPSRYNRSVDIFYIVAIYAVAKVFELLDAEIFALIRFVSGHTLKHLIAAIASYWIIRMLRKRQPQAFLSKTAPI